MKEIEKSRKDEAIYRLATVKCHGPLDQTDYRKGGSPVRRGLSDVNWRHGKDKTRFGASPPCHYFPHFWKERQLGGFEQYYTTLLRCSIYIQNNVIGANCKDRN